MKIVEVSSVEPFVLVGKGDIKFGSTPYKAPLYAEEAEKLRTLFGQALPSGLMDRFFDLWAECYGGSMALRRLERIKEILDEK